MKKIVSIPFNLLVEISSDGRVWELLDNIRDVELYVKEQVEKGSYKVEEIIEDSVD